MAKLILYFSVSAGSAASGALRELIGALDRSVTFPLEFTEEQVDSVVWTFNTTTLVTIQPKVGDKQATVIVTQNRNKERVDFLHGNYSLQLSKLKKSDSGVYRVEIHRSSSQIPITQKYGLRVYEYLSKPKVTMGVQNNKNGTCLTNLTCSMEQGGEDVTYRWKALGQEANESHDGSILPISWSLGERDMIFICVARNPISSNSSSPILARELCKGAPSDPDSFIVFLYLLLMSIPLSLLVLVLVLLSLQRKRKKEFIERKKRIPDIHQETPNSCPYSGENTECSTVSYTDTTIPKEDPANTLYSTVEMPKK
ncbi:PREDICTED: SLAM family member 7 [Galeopterus variegatus]|uniref:SLAM family member 7 n=1 Tax=Galeopterus variegatus TaxID=482537 RepID=A0ABM0S959_GALVR|nr:PREDICTED: SLAM family member 7 [Galeopterus variegatus]